MFCRFVPIKTITMKSLLFKSAWNIFKIQNVSFSEALQMAWKIAKNGVKAVIVRMNKTVKSERWMGYETIYYNALQFVDIAVKREVYNNDGAQSWYDSKTFNND